VVAAVDNSGNIGAIGLSVVLSVTSTTITFTQTAGPTSAQNAYPSIWITYPAVEITNTSNYYSTLAYAVSNPDGSTTYYPGTPYPHELNPTTDTLTFPTWDIFGIAGGGLLTPRPSPATNQGFIQIYNNTTWAVPTISTYWSSFSGFMYGWQFAGGTYSGSLILASASITNGIYNGTVTVNPYGCIFAGTFNGTVNLLATTISAGDTVNSLVPPTVRGGVFKGPFVRTPQSVAFGGAETLNFLLGGTYSPVATLSVNPTTGLVDNTTLPIDPGFALSGTYAPVLTVPYTTPTWTAVQTTQTANWTPISTS
jgi:hypothetical protein